MSSADVPVELPPPAAGPGVLLPGDVVTVVGPGGVPLAAELVPVAPDRVARLSWPRRFGLVLLPIAVVGVLWGGPAGFFEDIRIAIAPVVVVPTPPPANGAALFAANCASCHGARGDGKGTASLTIPARYFGAEPFKFTDTTGTKIPTDGNLVALLKRGIPGSSMPSFAALRDDELAALVGHVRTLTRRGKYEGLYAKAELDEKDTGEPPDPAALSAKADALCVVGTPLPVPASFAPESDRSVAAGRALFAGQCASCHGPEGKGNGSQVGQIKNDNGTLAYPRNLTAGVFKGGDTKAHLYTRLRLGIPGTPMPASEGLTPAQVDDLINAVLDLAKPPAQPAAAAAGQRAAN